MNEEYVPEVFPASHPIDIPYSIRDQHIFIPGMTRHGKSTQLLSIIMQDIENGAGVAVLDPKGGLIRDICDNLPNARVNECIYLDLHDPIPLDIMTAKNPEYLVGDLKQLVLKGDTSLKRAEPILTRIIYTLLAVPCTRFTDIEDIFTRPVRKAEIMAALKGIDRDRWEYWQNNWPAEKEYEPLVARMTDFTENKSLRTILGGGAGINIAKEMDARKIILVDLGGIGEPREIYGSLLVSQFQQAAFARTHLHESQIIPYHLFVDEFENFQTSSFAKILSVAGGLGLRLTVGNQYLDQLSEPIRHAILGNVGTYIIFHIEEHLALFKNKLYPYDPNLLARLPKYQAVYKLANFNYPIFKWTPDKQRIDEAHADGVAALLKKNTLAQYDSKRGGNNEPCNSGTISHSEVNGTSNTEPEPSGPPIIPSYESKTRKP